MFRIQSKDLLVKIASHIKSCHYAIAENIRDNMEIYREAAAQHPANFAMFSKTGRDKIESSPQISDGVKAAQVKIELPVEFNLPKIVNRGGYEYKVISINYVKSGKVSVKDSSGKKQSLEGFEVKFS